MIHKLQPRSTTHEFNTHQAATYLMDVAEHDARGVPLVAIDLSGAPLMRMVVAMHDAPAKLEAVLEVIRFLYPSITSTLSDVVEASATGEIGEPHSA